MPSLNSWPNRSHYSKKHVILYPAQWKQKNAIKSHPHQFSNLKLSWKHWAKIGWCFTFAASENLHVNQQKSMSRAEPPPPRKRMWLASAFNRGSPFAGSKMVIDASVMSFQLSRIMEKKQSNWNLAEAMGSNEKNRSTSYNIGKPNWNHLKHLSTLSYIVVDCSPSLSKLSLSRNWHRHCALRAMD